jgi:TolA-binding protein
LPQIYFMAGQSYLATKKYDKARVVFQNLLKMNPGNADLKRALQSVDDSMRVR